LLTEIITGFSVMSKLFNYSVILTNETAYA